MDNHSPQIRSRITVVCAECKRLKLKCDRRTPCGSCTKRDTVMRCIYSPAAAEKVDLHSLNNRLIQVEGLLTLMTAGKTPPPFQSSYPLAQIPLPGAFVPGLHPQQPRTTTATKPQITPGTASSSISFSMTDLNDIWLTHCQLDTDFGSKKSTHRVDSVSDGSTNHIKLEPSSTDSLYPMITDHSPSGTARRLPHISIYHTSTLNFSYHDIPKSYPYGSQPDHPPSANMPLFPPTSSSSPTSSTSSVPPSISPAPSTSNQHHHPHSRIQSPKPQPTTALLALLPAPPVRTHLLRRVRAAHPELAVLVPWDRIFDLSADQEEIREREKEKEKEREKERKTLLAKTIFYGARSEISPSQSQARVSGHEPASTLPLFVLLCYLLVLGGRVEGGGGNVDGNFVCALAGQAMGVWEAYRLRPPSHDYDHNHNHQHDQEQAQEQEHDYDYLEEEGTRMVDLEGDVEDMDHVLACLMQIVCLVRDGTARGKSTGGMKGIFPLIGKLVNLARGVGLAQDPDYADVDMNLNESTRRGEKGKEKERRRMLWWEVMFYDTFISDVLNQPATVTLSSYSTRWSACTYPPSSHSSRKLHQAQPQLQPHIDDVNEDLHPQSDDEHLQHQQQHRPQAGRPKTTMTTTKKDPNSVNLSSSKARTKGKGKASSMGTHARSQEENLAEVVFGVRCRLTHLTQTIKHQLAGYPGHACGCGCECCSVSADGAHVHVHGHGRYTLDQAVRLEAEIRAWAADLPPFLRLEPDCDSPPSNFGVVDTPPSRPGTALPRSSSTAPKSPSMAIMAAELAILANRLIMAVYVPFLRPPRNAGAAAASETGSGQVHPAYVAHSWSPASRATVDAARGVVRAGMVMHRLVVGVGAVGAGSENSCETLHANGTVLSEFYSFEKALLDAVVVCMHAGVVSGGVKVQKGKGVMEDVGAGLEVLDALGVGRRKGEMVKVVAALRRKVEGMGVSLGCAGGESGAGENMLKRKHDQVEVGVTCVDADTDGLDLEAEVSPPAEGMFLDYEGSPFASQSINVTVLSRSPSRQNQPHRRSPPGTDTSLQQISRSREQEKEQRKEKEKERKHAKTGHAERPAFGYRVREGGKVAPPWVTKERRDSRSGSLPSNGPPLPSSKSPSVVDYQDNLSTSEQQQVPPQMVQNRRPSPMSQDLRMHPIDFSMTFPAQPPQPPPQPSSTFTVPSNDNYHPGRQSQSSRAGSYEPHRGFDPVVNTQSSDSSAAYNSVGVRYSESGGSGSSTSNTSSPYVHLYGSASGNGTLDSGSPTYVQSQTVRTSPQAYFHALPGYEHPNQGTMTVDAPTVDSRRMIVPTVPGTPMYDVKSSLDVQQQMQRHTHTQSLQYQDVQSGHNQMHSAPHTWNTDSQQHHQPLNIEQGGESYWGSGGPVYY